MNNAGFCTRNSAILDIWMDRVGNEILESNAVERDLANLVDRKLNMSSSAVANRRDNHVLGFIIPSIIIQAREGIGPISSAGASFGHCNKKKIRYQAIKEFPEGWWRAWRRSHMRSSSAEVIQFVHTGRDGGGTSLWGEEEGQTVISSLWWPVAGLK